MKSWLAVLVSIAVFFGHSCSAGSIEQKAPAPDTAIHQDGAPTAQNTQTKLEVSDNAPRNSSSESQERKRIKTGQLFVQVQDLSPVEKALTTKLKKYDGYLASVSLQSTTLVATVKIPSENFEAFLSDTGDLGRVMSKETQIEDVTNQYYDLENRIKNKRILMERYQAYLKEAKSVEDLLKVERALNDVTYELESLEGTFKTLSRQVAYSSLTITFQLPVAAQEYNSPNVSDGFADLGRNVIEFFYGALFFILYLLIFGVPITLFGALLWWLLFGKIGWIKKLYRSIQGKKKTASND